MTPQLKRPRAKRKTVRGLQEQLIDQLVRQRPPVGSVPPSLSELAGNAPPLPCRLAPRRAMVREEASS